jgi:hypothetical protein
VCDLFGNGVGVVGAAADRDDVREELDRSPIMPEGVKDSPRLKQTFNM